MTDAERELRADIASGNTACGRVFSGSPTNIAALLAEIDRLRGLLCKCDMRTRLVGDGCEFCNPRLAEELAKEQR